MAAQAVLNAGEAVINGHTEGWKVGSSISLAPGFRFIDQDHRLGNPARKPVEEVQQAPLGVLSKFASTNFAGVGFNTIFRPNSGQTKFPNPVSPPPPQPPSENVLELNLTTETLSFSAPLGNVPNRGLEQQPDITLNGVSYVQTVNDVTNPNTGKADATPSGIHFEPGLWMNVPATTVNPVLPPTLTRMGSIPHGTTINATALAPPSPTPGPPNISPVDITPFVIGQPGNKIRFIAQDVTNTHSPRLPQDLSIFIKSGTITQQILDNPVVVLNNAMKGQKISETLTFKISTADAPPVLGGGTANIDFLEGDRVNAASQPNADAVQMNATFWIETVQNTIQLPPLHQGQTYNFHVPPANASGIPGVSFTLTATKNTATPQTITVPSTQIQYLQNVFLNFAGLTWPHVSVATLVQTTPVTIDPTLVH